MPRCCASSKKHQPDAVIFLQTVAERITVPLLQDTFLQQYPRINARALAGLLRRGTLVYQEEELRFPYECKTSEREILKWEEQRLKLSLKQAQKLMGTETLTLPME